MAGQPTCPCPGETLTAMPERDCVPRITRVRSIAIQRSGFNFDSAAAPTPNPIADLTSWQAYITALDDSQMVVFPLVRNFNIPEGSAETDGGYGDSTSGNAAFVGQAPAVASFYVEQMTKEQMAAAQNILCQPQVQMYMLLDNAVVAFETTADQVYKGFNLDRSALQNLSETLGPDVINKNPFNYPFQDERWDLDREVVPLNFNTNEIIPA